MKPKRIISILVCLLFLTTANATHIVGGSMSMKWVSGNTYKITLKVLRDCYNAQAQFDGMGGPGSPDCIVGMFDKANNSKIMYINMGAPTVTSLKIEGPNCANAPDECTEVGVYTKNVVFSPNMYGSSSGYYFSYQRCCRNHIIQNISVPGDAAIAIYMEVPPFILRNSTPEFTNNPFTYLCVDNPYTYNFNFIEPDGDSLHYSMVTPLNGHLNKQGPSTATPPAGPYPNITWLPNYNNANEIRGNPPLGIDPISGEISVTPVEAGVFVAAIRVEEFRFGVKLGEVRLELQFNVTNCLANPFPKVFFKNLDGSFNGGNFNVKIPEQLCFDINITDPYDTLYVKIDGKVFTDTLIPKRPTLNGPFQFTAFKNTTTRLCWQTDCSLMGLPDQIVNVEVSDNGCPIPKTAKSFFKIHIDSMESIKPIITFKDVNGNPDTNFHRIMIPNDLCFDIHVDDPTDSLDIEITGDALSNTTTLPKPIVGANVFTSFLHGETRFCWQTACSLTGIAEQEFKVKVKDRGCIPNIDSTTFFIKIDSMPLVGPTDLLCMTLATKDETIVEFGDSTLSNPYYYSHHIYRAVNSNPFSLFDSITSRSVKGTFIDWNSIDNRNNNYIYFMRTVNLCGIEGPSSDTSGTLDHTKPIPDQQKLLTVTVEDNSKIKVIWPQTWEKDFARYFLYKSKAGSNNFVLISDYNKIGDTVYTDEAVNVHEQSYCYYVVMKDTCQNYGPDGKVSCSILLKGNSQPFESHINWSPYNFWDNGTLSYSIYKSDLLTPITIAFDQDAVKLNWVDEKLNRETGKFYYTVEANENFPPGAAGSGSTGIGLMTSRSNEIELIQAPLLYVPNAFTPNGDNVNDDWNLQDVFVKDYELKVYNKWGQLIFTSTDKNVRWRGELADNLQAPEDVYVYLVSYTGFDESKYFLKGNVTVLK